MLVIPEAPFDGRGQSIRASRSGHVDRFLGDGDCFLETPGRRVDRCQNIQRDRLTVRDIHRLVREANRFVRATNLLCLGIDQQESKPAKRLRPFGRDRKRILISGSRFGELFLLFKRPAKVHKSSRTSG